MTGWRPVSEGRWARVGVAALLALGLAPTALAQEASGETPPTAAGEDLFFDPASEPSLAPEAAESAEAAEIAQPQETTQEATQEATQETSDESVETAADEAPRAEPPGDLLQKICFDPLGDLAATERALGDAGFERIAVDDDAFLIFERDEVSALIGAAVLRETAAGRPTTQCTLVFPDLTAAEADLIVLTVLDAQGLEVTRLRRFEGAVVRDFGVVGAGFSAPALGSTVTLSDDLSAAMSGAGAGGVSVLGHPSF